MPPVADPSQTSELNVSNIDIFRSAISLIDQHGEDATTHAAMQADAMLAKGDMDGKRAWLRILRAIKELQRTEPGPGERAH